MTEKQKLFCDEYLIDLNATQAAIRAGYSEKYAHTNASKLLRNTTIREYIENRIAEKEDKLIAKQNEVLKYLTSVMRGESKSEIVVVENIGDYMSEARTMEKAPDEKERLKAAELLGKAHMMFSERIQQDIDMELNINVDYGEENEEKAQRRRRGARYRRLQDRCRRQ